MSGKGENMRISVYGYKGTAEELRKDLTLGLTVLAVDDIPSGKGGYYVEYTEKTKGGRPRRFDPEQIREMRAAGQSYGKIARELGCSKTYVITVCRRAENAEK